MTRPSAPPDATAGGRHRAGIEALARGEMAPALEALRDAVRLAPENAEYLKSLGNAHRAAGHPRDAVACYQRALGASPDYLPARYNLGLVLRELGRLDEAEACFRRVHEADRADADALFHLGALLHERGRLAEADRCYRLALALTPDNPYLWLLRARVCAELPEAAEEAAACLRECLARKPDLAEAHYRLGLAHRSRGETGQALACYRQALTLDPRLAEAHDGLGNALQDLGRLDEAIDHYRAAIRLAPAVALTHSNLGCALVRAGRLDEAAACFAAAVRLQPGLAGAHFNLGNLHSLRGEREEALRALDTALRLQPDDAGVREALLFELQQACDWSRFDELCVLQRRSLASRRHAISPFSLLSIPSTPSEQLQCARNYADRVARAVAEERHRLAFRFDRREGGRIRVGYLSADLRDHIVARLAVELFEAHDRGRFELVAYSYGADDGSAMRSRLAAAFDRFVDIAALPHAEAAARIHADGIDILVDLQGYTRHARTEIVALRPAPVQVNFLGYAGTMGAPFIDYAVVDRFVAPPEERSAFSEALVRLPQSCQVNARPRPVPGAPERGDLGLPGGAVVFCCLNQSYKILPDVFAIWMRLLQAVPGSVLWLVESHVRARENLRAEAGRRGVHPERLVFAPTLPYEQHLARLAAADLFLDTFPYNAHTTASDAIRVGLPLITLAGRTFASRVAGSLLDTVGVPELIAGSPGAYEALALRLAREPGQRSAMRKKLLRAGPASPLFDPVRFARRLEAAYEQMWRHHRAGGAPRDIDIE